MKFILKNKTKWLSAFLVILIFVTAGAAVGCGSAEGDEQAGNGNQSVKQPEAQEAGESTGTARGRYMETLNTVTENEGRFRGLTKMDDGSLAILDNTTGKWISNDKGKTWEEQPIDWMKEMDQQVYIQDMALSPAGDIAVKFSDAVEDSSPISWQFQLVRADGTKLPFGKEIQNLDFFCFDNKGELFVSAKDRGIYQIDKDTGKAKKVMDIEDSNCYLSFYDTILVTMNNEGIKVYDIAKQEKIEDKVLTAFYESTIQQFDFYSGNYYSAVIDQEKNNVINIACRAGLFRHVIGGSAVEKVIDGNLNTFSNPSVSFLGLIGLEGNEFMVLFTGALTGNYTYDPEMPTVPGTSLTVYSLLKNEALQQAITLFRQQYQDVLVNYEVGIDTGSAVTREDAIKKLNTKIMAGEGPDLIMLDLLPIDSYMEKGILSDLTACLDQQEQAQKIVPGMKDTYKKDGEIFAFPTKFMVPAIIGDKDDVQGIGSVKELADLVEKLRSENPEGQILGYYLPIETLVGLSVISSQTWQKEDGSINKEALTEFLTQAKRIYETDIAGITKEDIDRHIKLYELNEEEGTLGSSMYDSSRATLGGFELYTGDCLIDLGYLDGNGFTLSGISSGMEDSGRDNLAMSGFDMEGRSYYMPLHIMGISASASDQKIAEEFLTIMMGEENQNMTYGGFSVNRQAFDQGFIDTLSYDKEERSIGAMGAPTRDGSDAKLDIRWPKEDWMAQCKSIVESVNTPNLTEDILKRAVFEKGTAALTGEKTVDQVVDEIISKLAIYMAE